MAKTPSGATSPYCSPAEFASFIDANAAGQLANDDGTIASGADLLADPEVLNCLRYASGAVEAACLAGERYQPEDLAALVSDSGNNSGYYLRELVATLAFGRLARRRGVPLEEWKPALEEANETLEGLRKGSHIFAFEETQRAGLPDNSVPTRQELRDMNLVTYESRRYFGSRQRDRGYLRR